MLGGFHSAAGQLGKLIADLATHTSNWTAGLATKLNTNLDTTVTSRASQTSLNTLDTVCDNIYARTDVLTSSRLSSIHSIQTNYASTSSMSTGSGIDTRYYDVTITAIPSKDRAIVLWSGSIGDGTVGGKAAISGSTSNTYYTVHARVGTTTSVRLHTSVAIASPYLEAVFTVIAFN